MDGYRLPPPPVFLATPGDPPVPWTRWLSTFETYLMASGVDWANVTAARRRAILVHCLGIEGQIIFLSLTETDTYATAVTALRNHFGPKRSVMMERYTFLNNCQSSDICLRNISYVDNDCFESIFIELQISKHEQINVGCMYRAPNTSISKFNDNL